ncbi:MAG: methyltransferase domain-containing protein [Acidobacteriota bacterium]|nr:methyltransferase domain-containing protein [Acidobacteriota bacterium]
MNNQTEIIPPMPERNGPNEPWSEEMAQWYAQHYGEHPCNHRAVALAALEPDDRLLDIGCGSGSAVREAARYLTRGKALGVDYSPSMIDIAEAETAGHDAADHIEFKVGEAGNLPAADRSQTVVIAVNSFHHWPNRKAGLAEVIRVLAPGGRLVLGEEIFEDEHMGADHMDEAGLRAVLEENGFRVLSGGVHRAGDVDMTVITADYP